MMSISSSRIGSSARERMSDGRRHCVPRAAKTDSSLPPRRSPPTTPVCVQKAVSLAIVGPRAQGAVRRRVHRAVPTPTEGRVRRRAQPHTLSPDPCVDWALERSGRQGKQEQKKQTHGVEAARA